VKWEVSGKLEGQTQHWDTINPFEGFESEVPLGKAVG
jgi:hypothetical protein